jgi:hypothetical protein
MQAAFQPMKFAQDNIVKFRVHQSQSRYISHVPRCGIIIAASGFDTRVAEWRRHARNAWESLIFGCQWLQLWAFERSCRRPGEGLMAQDRMQSRNCRLVPPIGGFKAFVQKLLIHLSHCLRFGVRRKVGVATRSRQHMDKPSKRGE